MLMFDAQQREAFARASFVARMQDVLACMPGESELQPEAIERQLQAALDHGMASERDCAAWVLCAWCLGSDFHLKIASVASMLQRSDVGPEYKATALELTLCAVLVALAGHSRLMP